MPHTQPPDSNGSWLARLTRRRGAEPSLREAVEDYIEEEPESPGAPHDPAEAHERALLANILELRDLTADDVMVPRADIVGLDRAAPPADVLALFAEKQYSRMPVYTGTLDDVAGVLHIKDVLSALSEGRALSVDDLIRPAKIIAPSMPVGDLLLDMRRSRRHMALVVDEFGGIDGLVTIGDIIESIVGQIADEHDHDEDEPQMAVEEGGTVLADARVKLAEFEAHFGAILSDEERAESETLGGLVFLLAGRVPARGEIITHSSGSVFEVTEADPRRIGRLRITRIPRQDSGPAVEA